MSSLRPVGLGPIVGHVTSRQRVYGALEIPKTRLVRRPKSSHSWRHRGQWQKTAKKICLLLSTPTRV